MSQHKFERVVIAPPAKSQAAVHDKEVRVAFAKELGTLQIGEAIAVPEVPVSQIISYANVFYAPRVFKTRTVSGKEYAVRTA